MASRLLSLLIVTYMAAGCAGGASGTDYAPQYEFSEFLTATNDKTFRVVIAGNPFPVLTRNEMERRPLPIMQANRPPSRLTFTYEVPVEPTHPNFRVVLVFDSATDLTAARFNPFVKGRRPPPVFPFGRF